MRKKRLLSAILTVSMLLAGCQAGTRNGKDAETTTSETTAAPTNTPTPTQTPTPTNTPTPTVKIENISNNDEGHYTFQPHLFSTAYAAEFDESKQKIFFAYCDAIREGADSFECPDEDFYYWCFGCLSAFFFPFAEKYVTMYSAEKGTYSWKDGTGYIYYTLPKDEYLKKEKEFEETIEGILNDCLADDYSDMEKALALYEYMTRNYTYDYDMYNNMVERQDELSAFRCLEEKHGICCEIAGLYNYLLLQAGVNSDEIGGDMKDWEDKIEGHSWVYVILDGKPYHIDPTWGISDMNPPLSYFMMTDTVRMERDGFMKGSFSLGVSDDEAREAFLLDANDNKYEIIWDGFYVGMDREEKCIVYEDLYGEKQEFSYAA